MSMEGFHLGRYDEKGSPCLTLSLYGAKNRDAGVECHGLIDTGFSRFIQVPFSLACSIGLPLDGINTFTLADGKSIHMLMALVEAEFAGKKKVGIASISTSEEILIGMEFLRLFGVSLLVSRDAVSLIDEEIVKQKMSE